LVSDSLWLRLGLTGAAFAGAVLAVLLTLALARGVGHTLRLLLAGVVVGMVLGAFTSLLMVASPQSLQAMQVFMLGSTSFVGWPACGLMAGVWLGCVALVWRLAHVLDGLSLGEATALSLGLPLAPLRALLVAVLALATGTAGASTMRVPAASPCSPATGNGLPPPWANTTAVVGPGGVTRPVCQAAWYPGRFWLVIFAWTDAVVTVSVQVRAVPAHGRGCGCEQTFARAAFARAAFARPVSPLSSYPPVSDRGQAHAAV
jgi:hypothetical protein